MSNGNILPTIRKTQAELVATDRVVRVHAGDAIVSFSTPDGTISAEGYARALAELEAQLCAELGIPERLFEVVAPIAEVTDEEALAAFEEYVEAQTGVADHIYPVVVRNEDGTYTGRYALIDSDGGSEDPIDNEVANGNVEWVRFNNGTEQVQWFLDQANELGLLDEDGDRSAVEFTEVIAKLNERPGKRSYLVERYEHGQVRYSIIGTGPQCQWDTAPSVAVLTLNTENVCGAGAPDEQYDAAAKAILDEYNSWCNGDVYGVAQATFTVVSTADEVAAAIASSEECWGYIGTEYTETVVKIGL